MPYYGRYKITIIHERQGFGPYGEEFGTDEEKAFFLEDYDSLDKALSVFIKKFGEIKSRVKKLELTDRWTNATQNMDADQMEKALEFLEAK